MNKLTQTGLLAAAPLYVIVRPNGNRAPAGVVPDLLIADNASHPREMIDRLLMRLQQPNL